MLGLCVRNWGINPVIRCVYPIKNCEWSDIGCLCKSVVVLGSADTYQVPPDFGFLSKTLILSKYPSSLSDFALIRPPIPAPIMATRLIAGENVVAAIEPIAGQHTRRNSRP